ncbi:MAG: histidine utilization repressor [Parvibaculaceae bacterium]
MNAPVDPAPLYRQVKAHILGRIRSGAWTPGQRVPSENEIVETFGVSRMTANRALRELTADGYLARVPGVGTFVKEPMPRSSLIEIRNIADEILSRGHEHSSRIVARQKVRAAPALAHLFETEPGAHLFNVTIVHCEDGVPVQIEDRYVNPVVVPDFLAQDFSSTTPTAYLVAAVPVEEFEHTVEAILPRATQARLLEIEPGEPCLALHRRTWARGLVVTFATLVYPASRYTLYSRHRGSSE